MNNQILFATDLDNTLIHSFKAWRPGDVCVEVVDGKEWSFMPGEAVSLLAEVMQRVTLVPVTTRSVMQYRRLCWPEGLEPKLAVTTNGACLLMNGEIHPAWHNETERIVDPVRERLTRLLEEMCATNTFLRRRMVDEAYAFVYCYTIEQAMMLETAYSNMTWLQCMRSGKKVYFFPIGLDKGNAVRRLKCVVDAQQLVCAGDSSIDIPMLSVADVAFAPESITLITGKWEGLRLFKQESFAYDMLQTLCEQIVL